MVSTPNSLESRLKDAWLAIEVWLGFERRESKCLTLYAWE